MVKEITKNPEKWAEELGVKLQLKDPEKPFVQKILKTEMSATAFCYQLFLSKDIDYSYIKGKKKFEENLKTFKNKYFISDLIVDKLLTGKKGTMG
ncbi:MAG: hypothetical protein ACM34K_05170 [Bacillota bacterium]